AIEGLEGMASFLEQAAQTLSDADSQLAQGIRG
ncbi:WXG100 family type VII secretion target, partial [Isoptericola sp. QY 916]|nr:WXG100 family type VII secretion target [Isoptericola sp. QY 916]